MKLEAKYDFTFLSISKWEPRKAWDILIKAYFDEFSSERGKVTHQSSFKQPQCLNPPRTTGWVVHKGKHERGCRKGIRGIS